MAVGEAKGGVAPKLVGKRTPLLAAAPFAETYDQRAQLLLAVALCNESDGSVRWCGDTCRLATAVKGGCSRAAKRISRALPGSPASSTAL